MTEEQVKEAIELHDNKGLNWQIIASYFGTTHKTLLKYRDKYELKHKVKKVRHKITNN